jgi:NAD-dependent DNA ligase
MFCEGLLQFISTYNRLYEDVQNINLPNIEYLISNGFIVFEKKTSGDEQTPKKDMNIVFSGVRDKKREAELVESGYTISDVVNNKTHLLVVNDLTSMSSKVKKAQKLGVTVTTLEQLSSAL